MIEFYETPDIYGTRCEIVNHRRTMYPKIGVVSERCGGAVSCGIAWTGLTEGQHRANVCEWHALQFAERLIGGDAYGSRGVTR